MITQVTMRRIVLMPSISSELVSWNRRASAASLRGVGVAARPRGLEATRARDHEAPGQHLVAGVLVHRIALAREQRLVDLEPVGLADDAVARDLVAGAELEQVVEHDAFDRDLRLGAVADARAPRRVEHRERVEGALRPHLLHDADERVGDEDDAERGVLDRADDDDHHEHRAEDGVEAGEHVRPDDLADGAAGALAGLVHLPARDALRDLGRRSGRWAVSPGGRRDCRPASRDRLRHSLLPQTPSSSECSATLTGRR